MGKVLFLILDGSLNSLPPGSALQFSIADASEFSKLMGVSKERMEGGGVGFLLLSHVSCDSIHLRCSS